MAIEFINAVYALPAELVSNTELSVLAYLANRADAEGRCWPTRAAIAAAVRLHEDTVKAILKALVLKGLIAKSNRYERGRIVSADIMLTLDADAGGIGEEGSCAPQGSSTPQGSTTPVDGGAEPPTEISIGGSTTPEGGGSCAPQGGGSSTPEKYINHQLEPSLEPSVVSAKPKPTRRAARSRGTGEYPPLFEAAWKAYPHRKGRSSKPDSLAAWEKLTTDHQASLADACSDYAARGSEPNRDCGAPAMERWLRKELYADWLPSPAAALLPLEPVVDWPRRLREWNVNRYWKDDWGPRLGQPGCQVPASLLAGQEQVQAA